MLGYDGPITNFETVNDYVPEGTVLTRITLCHAQEMIDDLRQNFKVTPRKSLTLEPPDLSLPHARDFVRGLIDGDGAVYDDERGRLCVSVRGTRRVLEWVKRWVDEIAPGPRVAQVRLYSGYWDYGVCGERAVLFYLWLHRDACVWLDRKRTYLEQLLRNDDRHIPGS